MGRNTKFETIINKLKQVLGKGTEHKTIIWVYRYLTKAKIRLFYHYHPEGLHGLYIFSLFNPT